MLQPNECDQKRGNSSQPWASITIQSTGASIRIVARGSGLTAAPALG